MKNNKLIITWKPDVLTNVEHGGVMDNRLGLTSRSEVESFNNVKSEKAAKKILLSRNIDSIIYASYNGEEISVQPVKKERKKFVIKERRKLETKKYNNKYKRK